MTVPALEVVDVTRVYELEGVQVTALAGVSLSIDRGEQVAIVGPSGSGKSTLMHLLGALDKPSSGRLLLDGRDIAGMSDTELAELRNRTIGFVFQSFQLLPRTSAVRKSERRRLAVAALEAVSMGHRLNHHPAQMSGGEQQRVAIARALVGQPAVLLADEPTGNLDSRNGADVLAVLDELNRDHGVAVVIVTHDREVADRAPRQIFVRDGLIERDTRISP
jgi:putative ABC transport system ATP-binding protein